MTSYRDARTHLKIRDKLGGAKPRLFQAPNKGFKAPKQHISSHQMNPFQGTKKHQKNLLRQSSVMINGKSQGWLTGRKKNKLEKQMADRPRDKEDASANGYIKIFKFYSLKISNMMFYSLRPKLKMSSKPNLSQKFM